MLEFRGRRAFVFFRFIPFKEWPALRGQPNQSLKEVVPTLALWLERSDPWRHLLLMPLLQRNLQDELCAWGEVAVHANAYFRERD